jgi:hypothetical protein
MSNYTKMKQQEMLVFLCTHFACCGSRQRKKTMNPISAKLISLHQRDTNQENDFQIPIKPIQDSLCSPEKCKDTCYVDYDKTEMRVGEVC